jgi:RNA polymerase sigma factor (sigma-70 family)
MYIDENDLALLKARDKIFLEELFRDVNPVLVKVCAANGVYNETISDIVQQTWEKFFENLDAFRGESRIKTFLCGILFNKIREHRRSQKKMVFEDDSEKVLSHAFTSDGWWNPQIKTPDYRLDQVTAQKLIQDCLEGLTEQQRTAFLLIEVEENKSADICNVLNVSVSNLRVLLFRAKDKLKKCLQGKDIKVSL